MASEVRAISCTQCGAPLELHGGHRVRSITCGYCGAVLDTKKEYEVVARYRDLERPPSPLKIGMSGTLKGVEFTVIGVVQWQDNWGGRWLEHQIFSPTHGYAWLEYDRAHFIFSRRTRDVPSIPSGHKEKFKHGDDQYQIFTNYNASVVFVEGELTYLAQVGNSALVTDAIAPPKIFSVERTDAEEEYLIGEYLDPKEVYQAFGVEEKPLKRRSLHPAQPYQPSGFVRGLSGAAKFFFPVALVLAMSACFFGGGEPVGSGKVGPQQFVNGAVTKTFKVDNPDDLLELSLHSNLNNAWVFLDIEILQDNEPVIALAKGISYYSGYEGGESWSEGSQSERALFKLPNAGEYQLRFSGEGGTGSRGKNPQNRPVQFSLHRDVTVSRYYILLTILMFFALVLQPIRRFLFERRRWKDEDDD